MAHVAQLTHLAQLAQAGATGPPPRLADADAACVFRLHRNIGTPAIELLRIRSRGSDTAALPGTTRVGRWHDVVIANLLGVIVVVGAVVVVVVFVIIAV